MLVAHSYGGFVATNAATGNANVKALVYIDAFMPDEGETAGERVARGHSCVDESALNPVPYDGGVDPYLRWDANPPYPGFAECFANGVDRHDTALLAATQRPAAPGQFTESSGPPAWKTIPCWSLIGTLDHVIPRALQEEMSSRAGAHITRVKTGHLSLITNPADVTKVILSAVDATSASRAATSPAHEAVEEGIAPKRVTRHGRPCPRGRSISVPLPAACSRRAGARRFTRTSSGIGSS